MPDLGSSRKPLLYCGIVWGRGHHDVGVVDEVGRLLLWQRIRSDAAGFADLLKLLARAGDSPPHPIPLAVEIGEELWVKALRATGRPVYSVEPLASARYHTSHAVSAEKSNKTGPVLLANILRTNRAAHRPMQPDTGPSDFLSSRVQGLQDAVWKRRQLKNRIVDLLMGFYPAAIAALADPLQGGLARRDARMILTAAPNPNRAAALTTSRLRRLLVNAGRKRHLDRDAERLRQVFTDTYPHQPPEVETAMGIRLAAQLGQLEAACITVDRLSVEAAAQFD